MRAIIAGAAVPRSARLADVLRRAGTARTVGRQRGGTPGSAAPGEQLAYAEVQLDGQVIGVHTSLLDIGQPGDIFDRNRDTLMRGLDANPRLIELRLDQPRALRAIGLDLATMPLFRVNVAATIAAGRALNAEHEYHDLPNDPHVELAFADDAVQVSAVRVEILDLRASPTEGFHIHVRELQLQ
ncbi:MAG: hypothetical protein IPP13_07940 [Kouleothrix sp.]|nr:hypothetical protein [Kouleothrix sp.]